jgi:hypothetical protein
MDLNKKLAQRRLERERESLELIQKNKLEKIALEKFIETESVKRLGGEGFQRVLDVHAENMIKKKKEILIRKIAKSKFSTNENMFGLVYIAITIWAMFGLWWFGLILFFIGILYHESLVKKYTDQIIEESKIEALK